MLERNAAERARVEQALAVAPPIESLRGVADAANATRIASMPAQPACPVCASTKLASDEVFAAGSTLRLVECLHCDHRFTTQPQARWREVGTRMARSAVARQEAVAATAH